jgi:membrane protein
VLIAELRETGTSVSIFGGIVLVWGTLRIFRGLDTAFSDIYESEAENSFVDQLSDGVIVLVTFAIALVAAAALESAFDFATGSTLGWLLHRASLVVGLSLVFFPMYYIFPDADVSVKEVLPGVLVAAVGLTAFESLFQFYVDARGGGPDASVVAGILILLTWLYFSGLVILLGAVVNAVLSNRSRDVDIRPVIGGVEYDAGVRPGREKVVGAVEQFERLYVAGAPGGQKAAQAAEDIRVTIGDETLWLPRPSRVTTETDASGYLPGQGASLTLEWSADALGGPSAPDTDPDTDPDVDGGSAGGEPGVEADGGRNGDGDGDSESGPTGGH